MLSVEYRIYKGELYLDKRKRVAIAQSKPEVINLVAGMFVILEIEKMLDRDTRITLYRSTCNLTGVIVHCADDKAKELFKQTFEVS